MRTKELFKEMITLLLGIAAVAILLYPFTFALLLYIITGGAQ